MIRTLITAAVALSGVVLASNPPWLINKPANFRQVEMHDGGDLLKQKFDSSIKDWTISHVTNNEVWYAMQLLFYGKENGLSIELGGLDGTMLTRCETEELEKFNWKRIVVEANPRYRGSLSTLKQAAAVSAAICGSNNTLHFANNVQDPFVSGIVEFMSSSFVKKFHPHLANILSKTRNESTPSVEWPASVVEVPCVEMSALLHTLHITHVNLWLLDTEGAELNVLRTVDWSVVVFDVIIVETEQKHRARGFAQEVKTFLEARDYVLMALRRGRNSWYRHKSFVTASRSQNLEKYMYFLNNVVYKSHQ